MAQPESTRLKNWRVGVFLAALIVLYIAAVIAFIIAY
jgi:hypothetical protein